MTALQRALIGLSHEEASLLWLALTAYLDLDDHGPDPLGESLLAKLDDAAAQGDASTRPAPMTPTELWRRMRERGADVVTLEHGAAYFAILDGGARYTGATTDEAFAAWCAAREKP